MAVDQSGAIQLNYQKPTSNVNVYWTVVDCGDTGPFYNGFKEVAGTKYGGNITFS